MDKAPSPPGANNASMLRITTPAILLIGLVLATASPCPAAEFRVEGDTLYLDGRISPGDEHLLAQYLASSNEIKRLSINSPGGDLGTGLKMGELVRKRAMTTFVEAGVREAASAAAYLFMSGTEREIKGNRGVGVHAFYTPQSELRRMIKQKSGEELLQTLNEFERRTQEGTMAVAEFVTRMIGDTRIVQAAVKTGSDAMVWPEAKTLKEWQVATKLVPIKPEEVPDLEWAIDEVTAELMAWLDPSRPDALGEAALDLLEHYLTSERSAAQLRRDLEGALARVDPPSRTVARTRIVLPLVESLVGQIRAAAERETQPSAR